MRSRLFWPALMVLSLAGLVGCSSSGGDPNYARVVGTVNHNGNPVPGAKVTFVSSTLGEDGKPMQFSAYSDTAGKYAISGRGKFPGLPPGEYKVTVVKWAVKPGMTIPESIAN